MIKIFDKNMTAYDGVVRARIFTSCSDKKYHECQNTKF